MGEFTGKKRATRGVGGTSEEAVDLDLLSRCPALHEYMTEEKTSDGKLRATSTVLLFTEGGSWKACMRDREHREVCFVCGETLQGALEALERGLTGDRLDWRPERQDGPGRGRK